MPWGPFQKVLPIWEENFGTQPYRSHALGIAGDTLSSRRQSIVALHDRMLAPKRTLNLSWQLNRTTSILIYCTLHKGILEGLHLRVL